MQGQPSYNLTLHIKRKTSAVSNKPHLSANAIAPLLSLKFPSNIFLAARDPAAGDVIIFHPAAGALEQKQHFWEQDPVFIKRVVAVEGDELEVVSCVVAFEHCTPCSLTAYQMLDAKCVFGGV